MNEETLRILKMVEEGKLNADKAKALIEALDSKEAMEVTSKRYEDKFLKIKVLSNDGDKVNVQLPIKVIKEVIKATGKLPIEGKGMNGIAMDEMIDTITRALDYEVVGELVRVESADDDLVTIIVE